MEPDPEMILGKSGLSLPEEGVHLRAILLSVEKWFITQAMTRTRFSRSAAARLLGYPRTTVVQKAKQYGLPQWGQSE